MPGLLSDMPEVPGIKVTESEVIQSNQAEKIPPTPLLAPGLLPGVFLYPHIHRDIHFASDDDEL